MRGHLEVARSHLSPGRGGEEEKPELRRRGDGVGPARRSRSGYGAMPSCDGVRKEWRRSRNCDGEMPRSDGAIRGVPDTAVS